MFSFSAYLILGFLILLVSVSVLSVFAFSGYKKPSKTKINDSVPLSSQNAVKIYEQDFFTKEWFSTLVETDSSPAYHEYIDLLKANEIPYFCLPVEYNRKTRMWDRKRNVIRENLTSP